MGRTAGRMNGHVLCECSQSKISFGLLLRTLRDVESAGFMKKFLHVGPGSKYKQQTTREFASGLWEEVRLDIDPNAEPDICGSILDMREVGDACVEAVYSSHNLEHVYFYEVNLGLQEFKRVLTYDGYVVLTCPDLKQVASAIVNDRLLDPLYESPAGPITPMDIVYGHGASLRSGNSFMAHKCGFTEKTLTQCFLAAGFSNTITMSRPSPFFDLWILATRSRTDEQVLRGLAKLHFP